MLAYRISRCDPEPLGTGAGSFKRLLGGDTNQVQSRMPLDARYKRRSPPTNGTIIPTIAAPSWLLPTRNESIPARWIATRQESHPGGCWNGTPNTVSGVRRTACKRRDCRPSHTCTCCRGANVVRSEEHTSELQSPCN